MCELWKMFAAWFLLFCLFILSPVLLILLEDEPAPTPASLVAPNATLVYSMAAINQMTERYYGYPHRIIVNYPWLLWAGVQAEFLASHPDPAESPWVTFVYNFVTHSRRTLPPSETIEWVAQDTVYYYRKQWLYAYNLRTNEEQAMFDRNELAIKNYNHPQSMPAFNGVDFFWTDSYPASCQQALTCAEKYEYACQTELIAYELATKTRKSLGVFPHRTTVGWATEQKIVAYTPSGEPGCDPKVYPGTAHVIDIATGKVQWSGSGAFGYSEKFINIIDHTLSYGYADLDKQTTHVINLDPVAPPRSLYYFDGIVTMGTAGADVLLYTPLPHAASAQAIGHQISLGAFNPRTGWSQRLDEGHHIESATGDAHYIAWATSDGDLYVAPVALKPATDPTPVSGTPPASWR